jgi:hypothetical protein
MVKITFDYRLLLFFNIILTIIALGYIIFYDVPNTIQIFEEEGKIFRIWYFDEAILKSDGKGPGMITAMIFNCIAAVIFIMVTHRIRIIRNKQVATSEPSKGKYMMANIYYSAVLLSIARILEAIYIITETDAKSILMVGLRIHIPIDNIAMVIFFSVCVDAFFTFELERQKKYTKLLLTLAWISISTGWIRIYIEMTLDPVLETIAHILLICTLVIIGFTSIIIETKIRNVSHKIQENQKAVRSIGFILFWFLIAATLSIVIFLTFPNLTQYILRTIKNIGFMIIALLFFPAFIHPAEKKRVSS